MSEFDVDLAGNFSKGMEARQGLRAVQDKRSNESAYEAAQKQASADLSSGLSTQPAIPTATIPTASPALSPSAPDASAPDAHQGISAVKPTAAPAMDENLRRVKFHELTADHLRKAGKFDLADAEIDKSVKAHGQYLANTQAQRAQMAGQFAMALDTGNIGQATDVAKKLTGMVQDGHDIQSLTPNADGTYSVVYGGADAKPVTVTKDKLVELAQFFASPDINKHYEEVAKNRKINAEVNKTNADTSKTVEETKTIAPKATAEIREKNAIANKNNADAVGARNGNGSDAPAEAKLVEYYIKSHGMKPEEARKFVHSSKEGSPAAQKARLFTSLAGNTMMSQKQKDAAYQQGASLIDGLAGENSTQPPAQTAQASPGLRTVIPAPLQPSQAKTPTKPLSAF